MLHQQMVRGQSWLMVAGAVAFIVGSILDRLAVKYDWSTMKRCLPALVVAVLLAIWLASDPMRPTPVSATVRTQPVADCSGWWYYGDAFCWFN